MIFTQKEVTLRKCLLTNSSTNDHTKAVIINNSSLTVIENNEEQKESSKESKISCTINIHKINVTVTFPHISDPKFNVNGLYTKIHIDQYADLFKEVENKCDIVPIIKNFIPKVNYKEKLGEFYYPY